MLSNHTFLDFWLIYALLSQNFVVAIYALFPQIFLDWKAESADFFAFRMYAESARLKCPIWSCKRSCKMLKLNLLSPLCYVHWKTTQKMGNTKSTNFLFYDTNYPIWGFIVGASLIVVKLCPITIFQDPTCSEAKR